MALLLFRALTTLLPRSYTRAQRTDATALTLALAREARQRAGKIAAMRFMIGALVDLIVQIASAWVRPAGRLLFSPGLTRDLLHGFRVMAATPGHSAAVIVTLAIGIGLNAAAFSIVDFVLLRPLPYPNPDALVRVWASAKSSPAAGADLSYSEVGVFSAATSFRGAAGYSIVTRAMHPSGLDPIHVSVARVTGDLFSVLGVHPTLGRAFDASEFDSGSRVVVLSHAMWRNHFGASPTIIGSIITLDSQPHTVVGVLPVRSGYPHEAQVWRPSTAEEREDDDRENVMIARLAAGANEASATSELSTLRPASDRLVWVDSLHASEVRDVRTVLLGVLAAATLVLVVASANVAALIGTRALDRAGELAVRGALGASGGELARQLLIEGTLLAIAGGALGIIIGAAGLDLLVTLAPAGLPRLDEITLDARVLSVSASIMFLVGIAVSVAPAWRASRTDLTTTLNASASSRTVARVGPRRMLVTAQIAVAVVLTIGAALLGRSLRHLIALDHGFDPKDVVAVSLNVRGMPPAEAPTLFNTLAGEAAALPGVRSAAVAFRLPTDIVGLRAPMRVESPTATSPASVAVRVITPRYFETVGIPVVAGRGLESSDTRQRARGGVVNLAFVREVLGGADALGRRLTGQLLEGGVTIVGVVGDVTPGGRPDRPALYMSYDQFSINAGSLLVKTTGDPAALVSMLRARIRTVAPSLPLDRIQTLDDVLAADRSVSRFSALVASAFGVLAFTLAMIGVYGLTSREVWMRRRESGLRAALGASRNAVMWELLRPVLGLTACGLIGGIVLAIGVGNSIRSVLHGVGPADPATFIAVTVAIGAFATVPAVGAAWAVARDPAAAVRGIMTS